MPDDVQTLNLVAVLVGAVAAFLFGWAVYSPKFFGTKWAEGSGVALGAAGEMPKFAMASQFVALLLLSTVVGVTATTNALGLAILAILAAAAFSVSGGAFVKKNATH